MDEKEKNYVNSLSKLINIATISNSENINKKSFELFRKQLKESFPNVFKNFKYEVFDGSILLSLKVDNNKKPILLMSHHDIVSCEDNWTYNPFCASVHDGKLYGRGTLDTKGNLWAFLTAIEELLSEGYKFNRSIYIESACNEESTGQGAYTISRELKNRGVEFEFTLDEGGLIVFDPIGGATGNFAMIALGEKDYLDLKFVAKSKGGHSSTPDKNNPLLRLSKFIVYVESHKLFKPYLEDTTIETFSRLSLKMKGILAFLFKHAKLFRKFLSKQLLKFSPTAVSMVKTTTCFTMAQGSDGYNIIPEEAFVTCNIRISKHDSKEEVIKKLRDIAAKFDIETKILDDGYDSPTCDHNNDSYKFLTKVIEDNFKDVICAPYISTGASDSKYFGDLSKNNFRFAPFKVSDEQLDSLHAKNENLDISCLEPAVNFYKDLLKRI